MSYNLFLDDERYPRDVTWVRIPDVEYKIVRNYEDFTRYIAKHGLPDHVSFDHDLGDFKMVDGDMVEYTGNTCAKWLVHYCRSNNLDLPSYSIHSMSSVGRQNIQWTLSERTRTR